MDLIDIGVNLTNQRLYQRLDEVTSQAINAGVIHQVITGTSVASSKKALEICHGQPDYFSSTAGCHPHDAKDFKSGDETKLSELAKQPCVVAIGECGLDFNRNYSPQDVQKEVFECQIEVAGKVNLPLFMHQRDAHLQFIDILSSSINQFGAGVIHCFTGDKKQLKDCLDLGLYIGITGWICDARRGMDLQEAVRYLPMDRIMVETDAPYLLPGNISPKPKSRTNVPANIPWIIEQLSTILNLKPDIIAAATTKNANDFFAISTRIEK